MSEEIRPAICCGYCLMANNLNDSIAYRYCETHNEYVSIDQVCDSYKEREE